MRVAGGRLRGRRLHSVAGRRTRPTSERARMGLFDWLGSRVEGAAVLDLFAGTGALGIEALSRGATRVVFVERSREALSVLRRNRAELGLGGAARVLAQDVPGGIARLRREGQRFDLLLADPPYLEDWAKRLAKGAELVDLLAPGGVLLIERDGRDETPCVNPALVWRGSKVYGETAFDWYERAEAEE